MCVRWADRSVCAADSASLFMIPAEHNPVFVCLCLTAQTDCWCSAELCVRCMNISRFPALLCSNIEAGFRPSHLSAPWLNMQAVWKQMSCDRDGLVEVGLCEVLIYREAQLWTNGPQVSIRQIHSLVLTVNTSINRINQRLYLKSDEFTTAASPLLYIKGTVHHTITNTSLSCRAVHQSR